VRAASTAAVDATREQARLPLHPQPHLVDDRPCLAFAAGGADREEVGVGDEAAHVEDHDVFGFFRVGDGGQVPRQLLGLRLVHR